MSDKPRLTERQRQILDYIRQHIAGAGYPPSVRQIRDYVGLNSTASVAYQLGQLESKGYIRRHADRARAIVLSAPDAA